MKFRVLIGVTVVAVIVVTVVMVTGDDAAPPPQVQTDVGLSLPFSVDSAATLLAVPPAPVRDAPTPLPQGPTHRGKTQDASAEGELLSHAWRQIEAGAINGAIKSLNKHRREFPKGALVEERDILWIKAHLDYGRVGAARSKLSQYHQNHPGSAFLPVIEAAIVDADSRPRARPAEKRRPRGRPAEKRR